MIIIWKPTWANTLKFITTNKIIGLLKYKIKFKILNTNTKIALIKQHT